MTHMSTDFSLNGRALWVDNVLPMLLREKLIQLLVSPGLYIRRPAYCPASSKPREDSPRRYEKKVTLFKWKFFTWSFFLSLHCVRQRWSVLNFPFKWRWFGAPGPPVPSCSDTTYVGRVTLIYLQGKTVPTIFTWPSGGTPSPFWLKTHIGYIVAPMIPVHTLSVGWEKVQEKIKKKVGRAH